MEKQLKAGDGGSIIFKAGDGGPGGPGGSISIVADTKDIHITGGTGGGTPGNAPAVEDDDLEQMVSPENIAKRYGFTSKQKDRLRKKLMAWRQPGNSGEWIDVPDRKPRQPQYLYRLGSIRHLIDEVKASG